jgi:hypothetical protein
VKWGFYCWLVLVILVVVAELVAFFGRFVYVDDENLRWFAVCHWSPCLLSAVVERLGRWLGFGWFYCDDVTQYRGKVLDGRCTVARHAALEGVIGN